MRLRRFAFSACALGPHDGTSVCRRAGGASLPSPRWAFSRLQAGLHESPYADTSKRNGSCFVRPSIPCPTAQGPNAQPYQVLSFTHEGQAEVFADVDPR